MPSIPKRPRSITSATPASLLAERQSSARLLDHVAELAFRLVDAPLELVDPRRELGRIEMGTADGIPGVRQPAGLLLELLDDPATPRLSDADGLRRPGVVL